MTPNTWLRNNLRQCHNLKIIGYLITLVHFSLSKCPKIYAIHSIWRKILKLKVSTHSETEYMYHVPYTRCTNMYIFIKSNKNYQKSTLGEVGEGSRGSKQSYVHFPIHVHLHQKPQKSTKQVP